MDIKQYSAIIDDHFPNYFFAGYSDKPDEIDVLKATQAQVCLYEKVTWGIADESSVIEQKGLRYGENPGQEAALYRPINGHLILAGITFLGTGKGLVGTLDSDCLIQFGKHPGKINLTDVDSGLAILKYFYDHPCAIIIKHNNPSGVAIGESLCEAYTKAFNADPIAPFGGVLVMNRAVDRETATAAAEQYYEVICAPDYEAGTLDILKSRKNLRIIKLNDISKLNEYIGERFLDVKSLMDGSQIHQWSYVPTVGTEQKVIRGYQDFADNVEIPLNVPVRAMQEGKLIRTGDTISINRAPSKQEMKDMWFAWMVQTGVISNSVLTARDGATVSIGVGGQDRVMMAKQCVAKAYESRRALLSLLKHRMLFDALAVEVKLGNQPESALKEIEEQAKDGNAGLLNAVVASDAFFPFRDGVDVLLDQGVTAIAQPGGSLRDCDAIHACNECNATMVFTNMRCFKH
ncbi:MAG: IMP cyclohydrolase [Candidatus Omnitrophota bacterium]|jgi:phosphoribosylaminoimidazolecarboxamide formyltransferase/IMP cyclohydrolase|nr:MAG: IMP cyclohydrolase [Candidatus Omnitrophota bacterium]